MFAPRVRNVQPMPDMQLRVLFDDGTLKEFDVRPMLTTIPDFSALTDESLFMQARPDSAGCGIIWNDWLDLSRNEVWESGRTVEWED